MGTSKSGRPEQRAAVGRVKLSPSTSLDGTFTVIHRGADIDVDVALEVVDTATAWTVAAPPATRLIEVWAAPWNRMIVGCVASSAAFGGPVGHLHLPVADELVAELKARGLPVRHRKARQPVVVEAELRAISHGWPVRYI